MRLLRLYAWIGPLLLGPLAYCLWWERLADHHRLAAVALFLPVLFAYVVPAIGTNLLGLWEIKVGARLGRIRLQHGFVFGSASALLAYVTLAPHAAPPSVGGSLRAGLTLGSVLAFWNWLYDIAAIRAGVLRVHNRAHIEGRGPEAIATEYAPVFFGTFGASYGIVLYLLERVVLSLGEWRVFWPIVILGTLGTLSLPVLAHMLLSRWRHGTWGLRPHGPSGSQPAQE